MMKHRFATARLAAALITALLASACAQHAGLTDVIERPAERALLTGLRAYEDGQYAEAERALKQALEAGLGSARDRATAHKHLAFVYCSSQRQSACEAAFREARSADPTFALSRAETGHPLWGPVYQKVAAVK
jgi:Tfp pilus assembly protein PilF